MGYAASALQYVLWPALVLAGLILWGAAVVDIEGHRRAGSATCSRLALMACCVSVVAVAAIASAGALFAPRWSEAVSRWDGGAQGPIEEQPPPAAIFSFGLERGVYAGSGAEAGASREDR